jgi:VCBS repeat protein/FG-GAP repeat protein
MKWRHLSSKTGALIPPGPTEQTLCLVLDIDRDGVDEFVIGCRREAPAMTWYRRDGDRWRRSLIEDALLPIEAGGAFCDIDGDGDLDIVAGEDYQGNKLYWWENPYPDFDASVPWKRHEIKNSGGNKYHDQLFGDFDGDGKPELVFWNQGAGKLFQAHIPDNPKAGPWPYTEIYAGHGEGLAQGDIDGDGKPDLLAGGRWFKYNGATRFTPTVIDVAQSHPRIALGDLNGDGRLEVVMVPGDGVGRLKWYERNGDPTKSDAWKGHELLDRDVIHGHSLAVADFNDDGHPDIFCGEMAKWTESALQPDHPDATMWLFLGDGKGGFTRTVIATGFGVHEAKVGDLNGDGRPDILAKPYCWDTPRIDLWLNERG